MGGTGVVGVGDHCKREQNTRTGNGKVGPEGRGRDKRGAPDNGRVSLRSAVGRKAPRVATAPVETTQDRVGLPARPRTGSFTGGGRGQTEQGSEIPTSYLPLGAPPQRPPWSGGTYTPTPVPGLDPTGSCPNSGSDGPYSLASTRVVGEDERVGSGRRVASSS